MAFSLDAEDPLDQVDDDDADFADGPGYDPTDLRSQIPPEKIDEATEKLRAGYQYAFLDLIPYQTKFEGYKQVSFLCELCNTDFTGKND